MGIFKKGCLLSISTTLYTMGICTIHKASKLNLLSNQDRSFAHTLYPWDTCLTFSHDPWWVLCYIWAMLRIWEYLQGYWWVNNPDSPNNYSCSGYSWFSQSIAEKMIHVLSFLGALGTHKPVSLFPSAKLRQNLSQELLQNMVSKPWIDPFSYVIHISKIRLWRQSLYFSFLLCHRLFPDGIVSGYAAILKVWKENF